MRWDEDNERWNWTDDGTPAEGTYRPCAQCQRTPEPCERGCDKRHDPCLGHIDGARSACCGHGLYIGYVNWPGLNVREGWFKSVRLAEE